MTLPLSPRRWASIFLYLPIESELVSPFIGAYRTFGLRTYEVCNGVDKEVMLLPDISTDLSFVLHLARIFTQKQLDPIHLLDVVEDLL